MNTPKAAKTSDPTQAMSAVSHHRCWSICACVSDAREHTTTTTETARAASPRAPSPRCRPSGVSGVSRSCRLQPWLRSVDTIAPPAVVESMAP